MLYVMHICVIELTSNTSNIIHNFKKVAKIMVMDSKLPHPGSAVVFALLDFPFHCKYKWIYFLEKCPIIFQLPKPTTQKSYPFWGSFVTQNWDKG